MPSSLITVDGTVQVYWPSTMEGLSVGDSGVIFRAGIYLLSPYQTRLLSLTAPTLLRHSLFQAYVNTIGVEKQSLVFYFPAVVFFTSPPSDSEYVTYPPDPLPLEIYKGKGGSFI
jgi:hypothetical protein